MATDIKLIAIDLDDTLLRDDVTISTYTRTVIQRAQAEGIHVVIATGRMFKTAAPVGRSLELGDVPMIIYSGGAIQTAETGKILYEKVLSENAIRTIFDLADEHGWYIQSYFGDELYVQFRDERTVAYEVMSHIDAITKPHQELEGSSCKLLAIDEPEVLDGVIEIIAEALPGEVELVRSKPHFLEITAFGNSKGDAVLHLAEQLGIKQEEIMAFGNAENDISMLEIAKFGVAVENAVDAVKAIATHHTASNNDDGVAKFIEEFVLNA